MNDEDFMRLALREAAITLEEGGQPVGAVITSHGEVIARDHKNTSDFYMGHAEMRALAQLAKKGKYTRQDALTIYTTIEPCVMCYGAILHFPISKIVYALEDPWGGATKIAVESLPVRHHTKMPEVIGGVLRAESKELMNTFLDNTKDIFWNKEENVFVKLIRGI